MGKLLICTFFMVVAFTIIDAAPADLSDDSIKKLLTSFLKLEDGAPATDYCKALHKLLDSEKEMRKPTAKPISLPEDDPDQAWVHVCEKPDVKIEDLVTIFKKVGAKM